MSRNSLPEQIARVISGMRRILSEFDPVQASVHLQMELERVVLLVSPTPDTNKAIRVMRVACRSYRGAEPGQRSHHVERLNALIGRLETSLTCAHASDTMRRLARPPEGDEPVEHTELG